jgi:hypothetical protein
MNNIFFDNNNSKFILDAQKFYPKIEKHWVYTNTCQSCNSIFGTVINRQHHCRSCGKSYCWECCHNTINLPKDLIDFPKDDETYQKKINKLVGYVYNIYEKSKKIVCNSCHSKLLNFNKIKIYIHMFEFCDMKTLLKITSVSKNFYNASIYWILKFKKIQYIPTSKFTNWELNMLNDNSLYFNEHSSWIKSSIRGFIYEKYECDFKKKSILSLEKIIVNLSENRNTECSKIYCSLKCKHVINIYDLIEIFENVLYYEKNYKNIFWDNYSLRSIIKMTIDKSNQPNNQIIKKALPIMIKIIIKLLELLNDKNNIDLDFIFVIFEFLILEQKKISYILNELDIIKNDIKYEKSTNLFIFCLEKYVEKKKIVLKDELIKIKKLRDFTVNIYYNNNLNYINSLLPIPYYFDLDMQIIEINEIIKYKNNNDNDSGIIMNVKIKYLLDDNLKEREKKILIKKVYDCDEYYINNLFKILNDKIYSYNIKLQIMIPEIPICDIMMISANYSILEIPGDCIYLSNLYEKNFSIKNYVYDNNLDKTVEKIIKNYSISLSYFCAIAYSFGIDIKNYNSILINKKGQLFFGNYKKFYDCINSNINVTKSMIDILGSKNDKQFLEFAKKTIELFNVISVHDDFINCYIKIFKELRELRELRENIYFEEKTINDIKIIND